MAQILRIDFVADVVCPWCYIGWRRLKKALAMRPDVTPQIVWRPFQLDPALPEEGVDRHAYMSAKFPDPGRRSAALEHLKAQAAEDDLTLHLTEIPISPNTNAAHRLIRWAQLEARQEVVLEAVMAAYFTRLADIGDPVVLAQIAEDAGMDRMAVLQRLAEHVDQDSVTREHVIAVKAGVTGVPFTVFDGRVGVAGAESPEELVRAIDQALETRS
jgi:predicted DsbA family dithiol-disulfide isomerase